MAKPDCVPCISVRQPWAELILAGEKDVENRSWRTLIRGRIAIHAALKLERARAEQHGLDPDSLPTGFILGTVELAGCVRNSKSRWAERGQWHWLLANPKRLNRAIPYKGKLGIYRVRLSA